MASGVALGATVTAFAVRSTSRKLCCVSCAMDLRSQFLAVPSLASGTPHCPLQPCMGERYKWWQVIRICLRGMCVSFSKG